MPGVTSVNLKFVGCASPREILPKSIFFQANKADHSHGITCGCTEFLHLFLYAGELGAEAPAIVAAAAPYLPYLINCYDMFLSRYSALFLPHPLKIC